MNKGKVTGSDTPTISPAPTTSPGPSWIQKSHPTLAVFNSHNSTESHRSNDADFNEFLAFVGWYAFLILCCILPTLCALYKRRRMRQMYNGEYVLNDENIISLRRRLEEMERARFAHAIGEMGSSSGVGGEDGWNELLRERDQDWEVLESFFGGGSSTTAVHNNDDSAATNGEGIGDVGGGGGGDEAFARWSTYATAADRRRQIMSDIIMGGMSLQMIVERDQRRKRGRGRRLVELLKATSLKLEECHLIPKEGGGGGKGEYALNNKEEEDSGEGDIELGMIQSLQNNETGEEKGGVEGVSRHVGLDTNEKVEKVDYNDVEASSPEKVNSLQIQGGEKEACRERTDADETNDAAANTDAANSTKNGTDESAAPAAQSTDQATKHDHISQSHSSLLPPAAVENSTINNNNNILSLYQTDDILDYDDDDDENNYSALCLPCTSTNKDTTTKISNDSDITISSPLSVAQSSPPQSIQENEQPSTRLVPPTCAICLISYSPGCYVTWSSNAECIHAFHRDCILAWLLKKEEPLCPCCRREFVSSSILNLNVDTTTARGSDSNEDAFDRYRRTLILQRSQRLPASRSSYAHSMPTLRPASSPYWGSFSTGRVRRF